MELYLSWDILTFPQGPLQLILANELATLKFPISKKICLLSCTWQDMNHCIA